ncbi:COX assembly mitochondrial protein homolog [Phoca vitulina]|uniref:COX assembly mitochondrial protein homolog n=1 Tax=Phoca vitulina TaxID=9720 RepID=UPI0013960732|nr:COX assembly mitochondrial protein homolog [Phoca vitulina]
MAVTVVNHKCVDAEKLKECLTAHYNDPAFYEECKMEYLKEREEFRKTGIPAKKRLQKLPTSM